MNTFALDKNYSQFNFEEVSIDDLEIISGGTGVANVNDTSAIGTGALTGFGIGYTGHLGFQAASALRAAAAGARTGATLGMFAGGAGAVGGAIIGAAVGAGVVYFG